MRGEPPVIEETPEGRDAGWLRSEELPEWASRRAHAAARSPSHHSKNLSTTARLLSLSFSFREESAMDRSMRNSALIFELGDLLVPGAERRKRCTKPMLRAALGHARRHGAQRAKLRAAGGTVKEHRGESRSAGRRWLRVAVQYLGASSR